METNLYYCSRTGRTISEKTMEDGNITNTRDDKIGSASLTNFYGERPAKLTTNGHDFAGEPSSPPDTFYGSRRSSADASQDEKFRKRINPLRIHLGKRPFVDTSASYNNASKKKKHFVVKPSESNAQKNATPRAPKLLPKRVDRHPFHNAVSQLDSSMDNEQDKPVPRLVPKSQLLQFKKGKTEKGPQLKEYAQSLGLQPMVKFKCRKCCSMSFKTLAMLKEHQLICRAQVKEPALSPESVSNTDNSAGGPSRVTRKVYLCSACGTYYENWNLFLHMREVHNRHICLFCLGMFSKAEKLSAHLTNKHNVQEFNYNTKEDFVNVYNGTLYLMCCACDEICSEKDDFFNHDCNNVKPKPVPVLVSKKPNNVNHIKNGNEPLKSSSTTTMSSKNSLKPVSTDKIEANDAKPQTVTTPKAMVEASDCEPVNSDASISSDSSLSISKDISNTVDSVIGPDSVNVKPGTDSYETSTPDTSRSHLPNGDDSIEQSDDSDSPIPDEVHPSAPHCNLEENVSQLPEREKEAGGIKLKLSLNNANSPVIINSTVDPTIGQQYKPPSRVRRPPKRYEKDTSQELPTPPRQPSIKMTICDKADSPFVKTTIIENNKEITQKVIMDNSMSPPPVPKDPETKPDSTIISTIYDNNLEDSNTLNRVPKLTVRVPKEFLDKDSSSDYSSDSDAGEKMSNDDHNTTIAHQEDVKVQSPEKEQVKSEVPIEEPVVKDESEQQPEAIVQITDDNIHPNVEPEIKTEAKEEILNVEDPSPTDTVPAIELTLDRPLDKYPLKDLLKVFLASTVINCIYCNHARKIAVNCEQLALHLIAEHRFSATVNSITAEELLPQTIAAKVKARLQEVCTVFINLDSYDSVDKCETVQYSHVFECFQCFFKTAVLKDLYLHNRKMHQKTILLCIMCKCNFYTYSELLCHLCPGTYNTEYENRFRCCLCTVDSISSPFRLMVHLRKIHHTCDVCLEFCQSQARLSSHVWKHKLHHLCYRCGIAYRNKPDITNHLFWKHGTESVLCKKCLQKKWPHVYHFCTPPAIFVCEECTLQFTRAVYLKVHKRFHSEEFPHICPEENCTEKFVSKKLLAKHAEKHNQMSIETISEEKSLTIDISADENKVSAPEVAVVDEKPKEEAGSSDIKDETESGHTLKKVKKKKLKDKDALLLDVNLPALNLSESDSSDESDSGVPSSIKDEGQIDKLDDESQEAKPNSLDVTDSVNPTVEPLSKIEESIEPPEEKPDEKQVLEIWDNFKKYQAKVEKQKEKTPPLVPIRKHVCDSDHDYCLIPTEVNGDDDTFGSDKKKNKKSPKKKQSGLSSSSSSSSDSDSSCSCGPNCSCSSSSGGSSSSSSSDSDSSDESGNEKKKTKQLKKLPNRRLSNGSNVDVTAMTETPVLVPEKTEPLIAESDLDTEESETDEEFYDENPQKIANKLYTEKRNQLMHLTSAAPSDGGSMSGDVSRAATPVKEEVKQSEEVNVVEQSEPDTKKEKTSSVKKRSKKKKRSKSSKKHTPIKINIPKDVIAKSEVEAPPPLLPNKITISLQSNTVQIPEAPKTVITKPCNPKTSTHENKRASKRRRVPNKFYGYSSDEESPQTTAALKPQLPPKLEWRKEDLPSPVTHKAKKEIPSSVIPQRTFNYTDPIRLTAPIPDPEPPKILMNSESMESNSDTGSSDEGALEIYQPNSVQNSIPVPPPTYLNSGTSSLPYAFQRPAVRQAREGESVYCYCRCPYDEVSEMIACDAEGCAIEWFHFECVGIMVPPKGKWYCPECRKNQGVAAYR
ncbi:Chromatin modification-related protein png2 [Papilio xuthus]|uniref:Chromatin modification-related protein png2 n=1 Tax=Papilio xuthus TaxID=66420 RepID=A0A194Q9S1_PAPXU|nr:Chromatin modification-related protein png2 [Papilio xuthus]